MNLILTRLPRLLVLTLDDISIEYIESPITEYLLLPDTLTKLCINNCRWPDYNNYPMIYIGSNSPLGPYSIVLTQKFHQLITFEYSSSSSILDFNLVNSFLENSPKLEELKIEVRHVNQLTFILIERLFHLKSIEFSSLDGSNIEVTDFYRIPRYFQITQFSYKFIRNNAQTFANIDQLITHFPNLTTMSLPYKKSFIPYIKLSINNLVNLKKLELVNECIEKRSPLKLNNSSITHLSLINFKLFLVNFEDFNQWHGLKTIKFNTTNFANNTNSPTEKLVNLNSIKLSEIWKHNDYRHCVIFYKK